MFMLKSMLTSIKTTVGELSGFSRANATMDFTRELFPTDACTNFSCTSPDVDLLPSMDILGRLSIHFWYILLDGSLVRMIS